MTWSETRNKGTSMKQGNRNGVRGLYAKEQENHGDMGTDINETEMQGQRMKQREPGQTEGCWRCDEIRMDFEAEKVKQRRGGMGWTLSEIHR